MKRTLFTTPQDAEAAFYEAFEKGDLEAMMAVWADDDDIVCVHPGGRAWPGVEQVRESWRQIFAGGQTLRFRLRQQQSLNGMTLVVHSVYEQITVGRRSAHAPAGDRDQRLHAHRKRLAHGRAPRVPRARQRPKPRASARPRRCIKHALTV